MRIGLMLAAVFVVLLFSVQPLSVAYTESTNMQFGLLGAIGNAIGNAISSIGNAIGNAISSIGNAISNALGGGGGGRGGGGGGGGGGTGIITNSGGGGGGGSGGGGRGGSNGGGGTGTNTGNGGSGGGGKSDNTITGWAASSWTGNGPPIMTWSYVTTSTSNPNVAMANSCYGLFCWAHNPFTPQNSQAAMLTPKTDVDFSGKTPIDGKTGTRAASNPLSKAVSATLALTGLGLGGYLLTRPETKAALDSAYNWLNGNVTKSVYNLSDALYAAKQNYGKNTWQYNVLNNYQNNIDMGIGFGEGVVNLAEGIAAIPSLIGAAGKYAWQNPLGAAKYAAGLTIPGLSPTLYVTDSEFRNGMNSFAYNAGTGMWNYYTSDYQEHPGRVAGRITFDAALLLIPATKIGTAGKAAEGARAADLVTINGKTVTAARFTVRGAEDLTALERLHLNVLLPKIEATSAKSGITDFKILYQRLRGDVLAAAKRNTLFLDAQKSLLPLFERGTIEHEISGHMKIFQQRFASEAKAANYIENVRRMRGGANVWLEENEANTMLKIVHGDEIFRKRAQILGNEVIEWAKLKGDAALRSSEFIENYAMAQNLVERAKLPQLAKELANVKSAVLKSGKVTPTQLNTVVDIMRQNSANVMNGVITSQQEMIKMTKEIVKILYR